MSALNPPFLTAFALCRRPLLALVLTGTALTCAPLYAQDSVDLEPIVVTGGGSDASPVSGGTGYAAATTATGVKAGVPVTEVPMSVGLVTAAELADRDPVQIEDALAYVPGVVASPWGVDDRYDQFVVRGFDLGTSGIFRDGLVNKSLNFTGFKVDPYMVQRIDVLKGPASVLYGSNDAAGLVNIITKRPVPDAFTEARLSYGSYNTRELGLDTGGSNADGTLYWRFTGLTREGANDMENSQDDRDLAALGVTWAPTDATSVTLLAHWQRDNLTANSFFPVAGQDYAASLGVLPDSFTNAQHPWNKFQTEQASIGWQAEHDFSENLTLRQNFRYSRQTTDYNHLYFNGLILPDYTPSADSMNFAAFTVDETARTAALDTNLEYRSALGGAESILTFGIDLSRREVSGTMGWDNSYQVQIANPTYGFAVLDPGIYQDQTSTVTEKGIYVQEHLRFANGMTLTAGLRRSAVKNVTEDHLSGTSASQKDTATTGMIGATWDLGNGFVPYASYAESFTVNIGSTFGGQQFVPTTGNQLEVGLRYTPEGSRMQFSAALFDITKTNVLTSDAANPGFSVQTGEVRHRGLELEARGQVTGQLSVVAGYTYLDARITRSNNGDVGNTTPLAPQHQASVWAMYDVAGKAEGLSLGGGLRYVGKSWGDTSNSRSVDSYLLADMTAQYDWDQVSATFGVTNLFDKTYAATCAGSSGCILGEGREMTLTLSKKF
ncbi:MAG: TonB-dependent siderophore receptor [Pseudomonadota bacterium]